MGWVKGSLSLCFLLANTVIVCVPLFALAVLRLFLTGGWRRCVTRRMDIAIDCWVSCNRLLIRALRLVEVQIDSPAQPLSLHHSTA